MKIIYGATKMDAGEMLFNGAPVAFHSPFAARAAGISMVFQHFSLFETLSVAENIWLGISRSEPLAALTQRISQKAAEYGLALDPQRPVHTLSVGERQRVEIVRALLTEPQLLILDEPTSVLTPQAVETLFITLRQISAQGCSILYISHKLDEIRTLCSACTVLRGGKAVASVNPQLETNASLSRLMIGAEPPELQHRPAQRGTLALSVRQLSLPQTDVFGVSLQSVSLDLYAGEIVGIAGVSGNGQQELIAALSGEDPRAAAASISLFDQAVGNTGPKARRALGLHFVPEERLGRGAVPTLGLASNLLLTRSDQLLNRGWIQPARARQLAARVMQAFNVKAAGPDAAARSLSGGNLQKFIVGREIDAKPRLLIAAQPTWGVDVGAAALIRAELLKLRDSGCALLVISEELDELFEICDRLHVIARGRLSPSVAVADATVQQIGQWMSGLWAEDQPQPEPQHA